MLIQYKEKTQTRRFASKMEKPSKNPNAPKALKVLLKKHAGRSGGRITVRHHGGRHKRFYRIVDFKRMLRGVTGTVSAFEYDPNRNVNIALIQYENGEKHYILAPQGLVVDHKSMPNKFWWNL